LLRLPFVCRTAQQTRLGAIVDPVDDSPMRDRNRDELLCVGGPQAAEQKLSVIVPKDLDTGTDETRLACGEGHSLVRLVDA